MSAHFRLFLNALLMFASSTLFAGEAAQIVFSAGEARVAGRLAQVGDNISEGDMLVTGRDGYLYLKTRDNGFFILRPNSSGRIVSYQIDTNVPANNRIKLELQQGVARHISGEAVKNARQNFRFNTPVAAIGVRGTDFTVFANAETTRVAVLSGGVIVSPLSGECVSSGYGPCDGALSRELFAEKIGHTLQVDRGQVPVLVKGSDKAPDAIAPPRTNEPRANSSSNDAAISNSAAVTNATTNLLEPQKIDAINQLVSVALTRVSESGAAPLADATLIWGRWQAVLDKGIEVDVASLQAKNQLIATNNYYAIMRSKETPWSAPVQSSAAFSVHDSQAMIQNQVSGKSTPASIENGLLQVDFAKSSFFTKFDLVNQNERFNLQTRGEVSADGRLYGGNQFLLPNNMDVRGALSNDSQTAAYLFQTRLDQQRLATGVISWGK
jgi:FecR protein